MEPLHSNNEPTTQENLPEPGEMERLIRERTAELAAANAALAAEIDLCRRAERRRHAQYATTRALAESSSLEEAAPKLLQAVCEKLEWDLGGLWRLDAEAQVLRLVEVWHMPAILAEEFVTISRAETFSKEGGIPGSVWRTGKPVWTVDVVNDDEFTRAQVAEKLGLHAAFGFPIILADEILGVLEFFNHEILEPDEDLLQTAASIGSQIGQFIRRHRAEQALHQREEQLRQAQKMESIGTLAGGIAHDFNNLLTIIIARCDLLLAQQPAGGDYDRMRSNVEEIRKAGMRAASLTRQLLAFSRKQILQPTLIRLNDVVSEMEKMLRPLISEDIELVAVLDPECGQVKADLSQIEQVLMNLVVNARDAMPQGGKLTIETGNVELGEEYAGSHLGVRPGRYVMLALSDTGTGMDRETRERIFEPFFTTKEPGKGTGLGLSTVYGIIRQSGGDVWVYSEPGHGTVVKVYLPRAEEVPTSQTATAGSEKAAPGGSETILLVEDEDMVRALTREIFEAHGYRVLEARDSNHALTICREEEDPIHLLVTDVVMPQINGRELAASLAHLHPEMRVLYMSGYADKAIIQQGVLEEGMSFIQKPFTPGDLTRKVREMLDAAPGQEK